MSDDNNPLDRGVLKDLADGDDTFLQDLLTTYFDQAAETLNDLRSAAAAGDPVRFGRAAHKLKGASLNIGASVVARLCQRIEEEMDEPGAAPTGDEVAAVEREIARVEREVRATR